jgi:hypothetical protein
LRWIWLKEASWASQQRERARSDFAVQRYQ